MMQSIVLPLKKNAIILLFISLIQGILFQPAIGTTEEKVYGASPGEKLFFNVHWMGVPGGRAEMSMEMAKEGEYKIKAMVETIGVVSLFHPIHDFIYSFGDRLPNGEFVSRKFIRDKQRGKKFRNTTVTFDQKNRVVTRISTYKKPIIINTSTDNIKDPMTIFYAIRSLPKLTPNTTLHWLSVGKKEHKVRIEIGEPKQKSVPLGRHNIIPVKIIEPNGVGMVSQEEALTIWLSADKRRMPYRVETRLSIGSVAADLIKYDDGLGGHVELRE
ncbi:MAG: DUF3108 domain-containing protein [Magnetococcales bacterium]|nr:DUF3108 domain-containing protein [Magnetococcales bacterium]